MLLDWELCVGSLLVKSARIRIFPPSLDVTVMGSSGTELFFPVPVGFPFRLFTSYAQAFALAIPSTGMLIPRLLHE